MSPTRVTVCQLDNRPAHRVEAMALLAEHVATASPDLMLLPELPFSTWLASTPHPDPQAWQQSVDQHSTEIARFADIGAQTIIATRPTVLASGSRRNEAFVWSDGDGARPVREKYYLPNEPGFWEATWYDRGDLDFTTVTAAETMIGIHICTELWFMEWARHFGRQGTSLLCLPRATPLASADQWLAGGRVAAMCSGSFSLSSNQWIPDGSGVECGGPGWVIDPDGEVLATTSPAEPFVTVEIDLDIATRAKETYPRYVRE